jgi:hypothetical protein
MAELLILLIKGGIAIALLSLMFGQGLSITRLSPVLIGIRTFFLPDT